MTLLPTRAIILPCTSVNICSPTGKDSAQLHWCLFPGNICKLCQSINKQNSFLFLSLVLVNATVRALPLLETSFPSAVRVWEMCQTSRAAAEQSPRSLCALAPGGCTGAASDWRIRPLKSAWWCYIILGSLHSGKSTAASSQCCCSTQLLWSLGKGGFSIALPYETPQAFCCWDSR